MEYSPAIAFTVGLFSALHCLGMCGGIIGALTFSLPLEVRDSRWRLLPYLAAYNLGRIASYTLAGAAAGGLGAQMVGTLSPRFGHDILSGLSAAILIGVGLYLAGWFPKFALIEKIGVPLWQRLEPLGQRLIPVRSPGRALLFGLVWGWLPCGLVYTALIWSVAAGGAVQGAWLMLAFGAGTLPGVITAGAVAGWMVKLRTLPYARQVIGLSIIAAALLTLWFSGSGEAGHHHVH